MKKDLRVTFDPSYHKVYGVINGNVYTACDAYKLEKEIPVILSISKELYLDTISKWLNEKEEVCNVYKHFCGVSYGVPIEKFTISKTKNRYQ